MKFLLFVEGHTEKKALPGFLKRWLDPRLSDAVGIKVVKFSGCGDYLKEAPKRALLHLNGPGQEDLIGVIGLLDLYGPTFYPPNTTTAVGRYGWAKGEIEGA